MGKIINQTFVKDDFLGRCQLASKYNLSRDDVYAVLLSLYKNGAKITFLSGQFNVTRAAVTQSTGHASKTQKKAFYLHPMAHDLFLEKYKEMKRAKKLPSCISTEPKKLSKAQSLARAAKRAETMTARRTANAENAIRAIRNKGRGK